MNSREALEHICKTCDNKSCPYIQYEKSRCIYYGIVKQDLEKLEKLKKENQVLREKVNHFKNVKNRTRRNYKFVEKENTKLKKAIKIIINKGVNELLLKSTKIFAEYNKIVKHLEYFDELTQEEYELVKEVFGND